jgi:hypothetical protein
VQWSGRWIMRVRHRHRMRVGQDETMARDQGISTPRLI